MEKRTLIRHSILIGITSGAILLLQINLTRLFAFLLFHHLVTLAVSIPFVGLGAAGAHFRFGACRTAWVERLLKRGFLVR